MLRIAALLLFLPQLTFAQLSKQDSVWLPFKNLIGEWAGTGTGPDGTGKYQRTYQFKFNKKFILVENMATYDSTKEHPKAYLHEDYGMISYDKARKKFVYRQFHSEGFVNHYVLESISADGKKIVFVTEAIENIPPGFRARETYTIGDRYFSEAFDLAEPGKDFESYTKTDFKRRVH